jgi:hypothetical protein
MIHGLVESVCGIRASPNASQSSRSELARDGLKGDAFIQKTRVIVNVHRRNAARTNRASTGCS